LHGGGFQKGIFLRKMEYNAVMFAGFQLYNAVIYVFLSGKKEFLKNSGKARHPGI